MSGRVSVKEEFHVSSSGPAQTEQFYAWRKILTNEVFLHNERLLQFGQFYPPIHVRPLQQCCLGCQVIATELRLLRSIPAAASQIQHDLESNKDMNSAQSSFPKTEKQTRLGVVSSL